jgi:hypothetical protein
VKKANPRAANDISLVCFAENDSIAQAVISIGR